MSDLPEPRDDALLNQVDRLLLDRNPSGNPLLDDLSGSIPQARPAFQQQLEQKLVAQYEKTGSERPFMPAYPQKRKRHPLRLSFGTIAAALVGILIGAGVMFSFAIRQSVVSELAASTIGCDTPTWTQTYTVRQSDTLSGIAARYAVSPDEIAWQNCLEHGFLNPGMQLRVPVLPADVIAELTAVAVATPVFPKAPTLPALPVEPVMPPLPADVNLNPTVQKTIGILVGSGVVSHCAAAPEPDEISDAVAKKLAETLKAQGYNVEILRADSEALIDFRAYALLALYTDGCAADPAQDVSGFLPVVREAHTSGSQKPDYEETLALTQCIIDSYTAGTDLSRRYRLPADDSTVYPFFQQINPATPALVLRMGSLAKNRETLVEKQADIAAAIAHGIDCYVNAGVVPPLPASITPESAAEAYLPIVIAAQDIPADTLIMPDMVTRIFVTRETLASLAGLDAPELSADLLIQAAPEGYYGNLEDVLWQRAMVKIPRWQPVKNGLLSGAAGKTIGLVTGFNDMALYCTGKVEPVQVNEAVAGKLTEILHARGYKVERMYPNSPLLNQDLEVDLLLALYTDGCPQDERYESDGFLPVQRFPLNTQSKEVPGRAEKERFMQCVTSRYADSTGLVQRTSRTLDNTLVYPLFGQIDPNIPALVLRMGSLATNQEVLLQKQTEMAAGLANGIDCFTDAAGNIADMLQMDKVAFAAIPINVLNTMAGTIKAGDNVNIIATLLFVNTEAGDVQIATAPDENTRTVVRTIIKNAEVMQIGTASESDDTSTDTMLTLALLPQDAVVLQWMIDAKVPLTFEIAD